MTAKEETALIEDLKNRFHDQTGKYIKIQYSTKWESICKVSPNPIKFSILCQMIYDALGWQYDTVFGRISTSERNPNGKRMSLSSGEKRYRRSLIDFIAVNNDISITVIGRETDRHHTTILHSYGVFEEKVKNNIIYQNILKEVVEFIKTNYYLYIN